MLNFFEIPETSVFWKILFYLNQFEKNTFLILLVFMLVLKNNFSFRFFKKRISTFLLFILILYYLYNSFYFIYNEDVLTTSSLNNVNLINGLLIIHPILMYLGYARLLVFFFEKKTKYISNYIFIKKNIIVSVWIVSLTVLLGCVWAQQELNWGGWWAWDPVELISLIVLIIFIWLIHIKNKSILFYLLHNNRNLIFIYLLFFLLIVRYDIFNSVHSFLQSEVRDLEEVFIFWKNILIFFISIVAVLMVFFVFRVLFSQRCIIFLRKYFCLKKRYWFNFFINIDTTVIVLLIASMLWIFILFFFLEKNKIEKDDYIHILVQIKHLILVLYVFIFFVNLFNKNIFLLVLFFLVQFWSYSMLVLMCYFLLIILTFYFINVNTARVFLHILLNVYFIVVYTYISNRFVDLRKKFDYSVLDFGNLHVTKTNNIFLYDKTNYHYNLSEFLSNFSFLNDNSVEHLLNTTKTSSLNNYVIGDFFFLKNPWDFSIKENGLFVNTSLFDTGKIEYTNNVLYSNIINTNYTHIKYYLENYTHFMLIDEFNIVVGVGILVIMCFFVFLRINSFKHTFVKF